MKTCTTQKLETSGGRQSDIVNKMGKTQINNHMKQICIKGIFWNISLMQIL
jgi:hypothetical protein